LPKRKQQRLFEKKAGRGFRNFLALVTGALSQFTLIGHKRLARVAASQPTRGRNYMPLSFGTLGKAIALLVVAAFVLWLILTYFFATEKAADDAEQTGTIERVEIPIG
jgi:hypothetical protein